VAAADDSSSGHAPVAAASTGIGYLRRRQIGSRACFESHGAVRSLGLNEQTRFSTLPSRDIGHGIGDTLLARSTEALREALRCRLA